MSTSTLGREARRNTRSVISTKTMRHRVAAPGLLAAAVQAGLLGLTVTDAAHAQPAAPAPSAAASQAQLEREEHRFNIAAQPLSSAITEFSNQTGADLFSQGVDFSGLTTQGVTGRYTLEDGLRQLLADTDVGFHFQPQSGSDRLTVQLVQAGDGSIVLGSVRVEGREARNNDGDWVYGEARSVSVVTREQIDRRPPRHAADMLVDVPGAASAVNRHNPALSVNIRGMQDFGRVNMMIDGMRQNHVESGHQQRNGEMYIDSELLSGVVIEKGPSAGVYGANAIAGSANFRTLGYDDIILPGQDYGVRLRGSSGVGGYGNGVNFLGSAAVAGRVNDRLELLLARSQKNLGEYDIGKRGRTWETQLWDPSQSGLGDHINNVRFSDQKQDSWLAKARLALTESQALQFTYISTEIAYNNVSDTWNVQNSDSGGWREFGSAEAASDAYTVDYNFSPDSPLIDLQAKLYFVTTENQRITEPAPNAMADMVWDFGYCTPEPLGAFESACVAGLRHTNRTRTDTWGLQLENTSRFEIGLSGAELSANYGLEWFQDEGKSGNKADRDGVTTPYFDEQLGNNLNPNGRRDVASAFASLTLGKDPFTLKAGLRYDWYQLRGETTVPGVRSSYLSRFESYLNYWCSRPQTNATNRAGCEAGMNGGEAGAIAWWESAQSSQTYYSTTRWSEEWIDEAIRYEYDVDRNLGKFSPFISAAYKPLDWLELFANWGKGFRPPAMTETLWEGAHGSGSSSYMYPNPLLDSERSTSWEVGLNVLRQGFLKTDDRLGLKLAYFDTKVDNFIFTKMNNTLPGQTAGIGLGNTFFVNNEVKTHFRGLELNVDYDAGFWYSGLNYTRMLGGENDFCGKVFPLGSQVIRHDQPNEDGSMTSQHQQAIAEGYGSYQEKLDAMTICTIELTMNATRSFPADRGSAHAGIRLFKQTLDVGLRVNRSESNTPSNWGNQNLWESYTTWDFYARYQPIQNLVVSLMVENIRDRNYLSVYSDMFSRTYAPGRTVQAGLEIRF